MTSFSGGVKHELCAVITDRDKKYACFYGMLLFCRTFTREAIVFQTENSDTAGMFQSLAGDVLGRKNVVSVRTAVRKSDRLMYLLTISDRDCCESIFFKYRISDEYMGRIQFDIIDNNNMFAFFAGAFLSCGCMTDPNKDYHLEFKISGVLLCEDFRSLLGLVGIEAKCTERKNYSILYIKGSEKIEDLLTLMGATQSSLDLMNIKILKDIRNKANRIANCDAANIDRTILASEKQIADIEYIISAKGIDYLSDELQEMALIRLENPDLTLKELGQLLSKPLGRSGANHRIMRITAAAEELRKESEARNEQ